MKHFLKTVCALCVLMLAVSSCQKNMEDTLDEHTKTLAEYGNRIAALETLCSKMNTNIASLQTITAALEGNDYVKSVTPVTQGGKTIGYTITFTKSSPITIYHGTDGKNGTTPIVGISKFTDGNWYWTLNGAWLLDNSGKKIKANGTDGTNGAKGENGKDAIAPQLKIEGGKWKLSTDGGKTWTEAGTATGPQGEPGICCFKDVEETDTEVIFTLADNTTIAIQKNLPLKVGTDAGNDALDIDSGAKTTIDLLVPAGVKEADYAGMSAQLFTVEGNAIGVATRAEGPTWEVAVTNPTFDGGVTKETGATVTITAPYLNEEVILEVSLLLADGSSLACRRILKAQIPNDKIYYTSTDGSVVAPTNPLAFDASIVSNTYENGQGVIQFDGVVTAMLNAFKNCTKLSSINIPNGVTSLGMDTFSDCENLECVNCPNGLTSIDGFTSCQSLTSINIPENVQSIRNCAFQGCTSLTNIKLPKSLTRIGSYAFEGCRSLSSINIPNGVTSIESQAFYGCKSLSSVHIPNSVTSIGIRTFYGCTSLTSITIPNSVTSIPSSMFQGCKSLTSIIIPNSVTSIGSCAFSGCINLVNFSVENYSSNLTSIGNEAFDDCKSLSNINLPSRLTTIGIAAFRGCNLSSIDITTNLSSIGSNAFAGCDNLISVKCYSYPPAGGNGMFNDCHPALTIWVTNSHLVEYKSCWSEYESIINGF